MSNNLLKTNENLSNCDAKDVISFNNEIWLGISNFKDIVSRAFLNSGINSIADYISSNSSYKNINNIGRWFYQGQECEILRAGSKGWQKGKIKINVTLEFIPDKPEQMSPLDDIRQELERDNS
jgi:hypothetical protein